MHISLTGSYCKVATTAIQLVQLVGTDTGGEPQLPIEEINCIFIEIGSVCPLLTFQWCYMLILLGYSKHAFWSRVLNTGNPNTTIPRYYSFLKMYLMITITVYCLIYCIRIIFRHSKPFNTVWGPSPCCNLEIVRRGGIILFSDFVVSNYIFSARDLNTNMLLSYYAVGEVWFHY